MNFEPVMHPYFLCSVLYITVWPFSVYPLAVLVFVLLPFTASDHLLYIVKSFLRTYYISSLGGYGTYVYHAYVIMHT